MSDPAGQPPNLDPGAITTFNVGIRFELLDPTPGSSSGNQGAEGPAFLDQIWHWALVFKYRSNDSSHYIQIELAKGDQSELVFPVHFFRDRYSLELGTWTGSWNDIMKLRGDHKMQGQKYCPLKNNCQHWVARMLVGMGEFANSTNDRVFEITEKARYDSALGVLKIEGGQIENRENPTGIQFVVTVAGVVYLVKKSKDRRDDKDLGSDFGASVEVPKPSNSPKKEPKPETKSTMPRTTPYATRELGFFEKIDRWTQRVDHAIKNAARTLAHDTKRLVQNSGFQTACGVAAAGVVLTAASTMILASPVSAPVGVLVMKSVIENPKALSQIQFFGM